MNTSTLAIIYALSMSIIIIFQGCLAAGLPWGAASMGGKFPGKYPPKMRIVAVINMFVLSFLALIVLSKAGLVLPQITTFANYAIWFVVAFGLVSIVLNSITRSKIERIWVPFTVIQFITSLYVALG